MNLALVKQHLRVDGDDEDLILISYIESAKAHVDMHCDRVLLEGFAVDYTHMVLTKVV